MISSDPIEEYKRDIALSNEEIPPYHRQKEIITDALINIKGVKNIFQRFTHINEDKLEGIQIQYEDNSYSPILILKLDKFRIILEYYLKNREFDPGAIRSLEFKPALEIIEFIKKLKNNENTDSEEEGFVKG